MRRVFARLVFVLCGLMMSIDQATLLPAHAATSTWNGNSATTSDWTDSTNWTGGVPTNDGTADVVFGGTNRLDSTVDTNNPWDIKSITFDNTAGMFEIQGNALKIEAGGITNNSNDVLETIDNNISTGAVQTWTANTGDLSFTGTITVNSSTTVSGAKDTTFSGSLAGNANLNKDGAGTLTMAGSTGGFTGGVTISNGTMISGAPGGLPGNVTYTINGGTLDLNGQSLTMSGLNGSGGEVKLNSADLTINNTINTFYGGAISGSGALIKDGTALQELTGTNSYTGGTMVNAGTLQGTAGVGLQGDITDNANVAFNQASGTGTYADVVSGTGTVNKIGNGIVVLTGANTYSGGTTVTAGMLQGDTTSLQGGNSARTIGLANNARVSFTQNTDGTYAGTVNGAGGVVKDGTGVVTFTGTNTYTGATTITAGTLQLGNGGTAGEIGTGDVVDNATLAFNRSDTVTFNNVISGTGGLHQEGSGTLILGGTNTYTGATTIDAGSTLQIGNNDTSGNLGSGAVRDNGTLIFDRTDAVTANNNISGSGALVQMGTDTLILGGTNSYTGGTTVANGVLQGTTSSLQGNIATAAATSVVFDQTFDGSTGAVISGREHLPKKARAPPNLPAPARTPAQRRSTTECSTSTAALPATLASAAPERWAAPERSQATSTTKAPSRRAASPVRLAR